MPVPGTGRCVEVVVLGHSASELKAINNIFQYRAQSVPVGGYGVAKSAFYADFMTSWNAVFASLSVDYIMDETTIRNMENPMDMADPFSTSNVDGATTGDFLPPDQAMRVRFNTVFRGRSFRGAKSFGPIAESSTTGAELSGAFVTASLANLAIALPGIITSGIPFYPVVYSPTRAAFYGIYDEMRTVTSFVLNATIGNMKRRKEKTVIGGVVT